jgi:hypothetical protein
MFYELPRATRINGFIQMPYWKPENGNKKAK